MPKRLARSAQNAAVPQRHWSHPEPVRWRRRAKLQSCWSTPLPHMLTNARAVTSKVTQAAWATVAGATMLMAEAGPGAAIDPPLARQYFEEARELCQADAGHLWGKTLCGPLLFASPETLEVVGSSADPDGRLRQDSGVWIGRLNPDMRPGNTAIDWAGQRWTLLVWPLPDDPVERRALLMHEAWHRIQGELEFPSPKVVANHLDTHDGRIWLSLEWRALQAALGARGAARLDAIRDAVVFRRMRYARTSADARESEIALEMFEGLAEYTGRRLCGLPLEKLPAMLIEHIDEGLNRPSFVRTFPYYSGPAWGLLLDLEGVPWREGLEPGTDLGERLAQAAGLELPGPSEVEATAALRAQSYGFAELDRAERVREDERLARLDRHRRLLVREPHLRLSLVDVRFNVSFDPRRLTPLDELGSVYGKLRVAADWGELDVDGAPALLSADWTELRVPWPEERAPERLAGKGWELRLSPDWQVKQAGDGDWLFVARRAKR